MSKTYTFDSFFTVGADLDDFDQDTVKNEPMLFSCDFSNSWKMGGPITKNFLTCFLNANDNTLPSEFIVDTRVHMLMPGWFPCIPGFHHDDVARTRSDGQPDYDNAPYRAKHYMALINGDICPTEFAVGSIKMPEIPIGGTIYKEWHPQVVAAIEYDLMDRVSVPTNKLIHFDDHAFHQGVRAVKSGWRWFGRITYGSHRKPTNEIRRQVQVYLEHPMEGW